MTPAGTVKDSDNADVTADYAITFTPVSTGEIDQLAITVTAAANTKTYDGDTSAAATPTISTGTLASGDTSFFTESYDTKHAGTGKTLTPGGTVKDSGNNDVTADYLITITPVSTGEIDQLALTVTAAANTKTYDGDQSATAVPTISTGTLAAGDTSLFTETYDTKDFGTGKTLTPGGTVKDSGNNDVTADYLITFTSASTGEIDKKVLTVSITADGKTYDGTDTAVAHATLGSGVVGSEDVSFADGTATFASKHHGTQTVTDTGIVLTGLDAGNYTVNSEATATATIDQAGDHGDGGGEHQEL